MIIKAIIILIFLWYMAPIVDRMAAYLHFKELEGERSKGK